MQFHNVISRIFYNLWEAYPFAMDGEILIIVYILMIKASEEGENFAQEKMYIRI